MRVVVVVVVAMPLVRGDVGVRSVFLFVVLLGAVSAVRAVHNLILLAKTRAKIKIVCKIEKMAKWWFNFGSRVVALN